mmetsp:Transcript_2250/g.3325  ORF Transcript_2250/g.3325 Transcript_2250/m.3325 type:complete len:602 (+) Transcript_2250:91-1896(+)
MRSSSNSLAFAIIVAVSSTSAAVNYASARSSRSSHTSLLHRHRLTRRQQLDLELQQYQNGNKSLKNDPARHVATIARGGGSSSSGTTRKSKSKRAQGVRAATQSNDNTSDDAAPIIVRGGASNNSNNEDDGSISLLGITINPRALATLSMAICMSLHYLAYSLARPATMTLFTSSRLGFGNNVSAYPFAMTFISPVSFVLLLFYGSLLNNLGPLLALKHTTLGCASILGLSSLLISKLDPQIIEGDTTSLLAILTRYTVGALFIFRESYVQLITSQHWSFISSVLTPNQSSTWFAPISGLTSITSALAAMGVGKLSAIWGLQGVLGVAAVVLGGSVVFGEAAYGIAEKNGFNPADEHKKKHGKSSSSSKTNNDESLITKARDVFTRVPTLWALFCEILACQGLSTVLNVLTVTKVSEVISDDTERAGWMGNFFATINVLSCVFQFGILPATSKYTEPSMLWKGMPMLMLAMTCFVSVPKLSGGTNGDPSLNLIASAFLVMKTLEFSVRRMLDEMVYVPLDFESRFLGKEVIGVLGYRFGKSAASLALSALTSSFGTIGLRELSYFTTGAASVWLVAAWKLSALVPTRAEAEEAYEKMKKSS